MLLGMILAVEGGVVLGLILALEGSAPLDDDCSVDWRGGDVATVPTGLEGATAGAETGVDEEPVCPWRRLALVVLGSPAIA